MRYRKAVQIHAIPRQNVVLNIFLTLSVWQKAMEPAACGYRKRGYQNGIIGGKENLKAPTVIEFMIQREENVLPIVPPGNALKDMMMGGEEAK